MKEAHCTVHGKVQGVWFRAWAADMALELGVTGWVRNRPDGSVEAVGQGQDEALERFVERLHEGPPLARVSRVDTDWRDAGEPFSRFSVAG